MSMEVGMKALSLLVRAATCAALSLIAFSAVAADYPTPQEGDWVARDFRFHTGEVMPELRLHYRTVGDSSGQAVLVLHGTALSSADMRQEDAEANSLYRWHRTSVRPRPSPATPKA